MSNTTDTNFKEREYVIPANILLERLGVHISDINKETVTVKTDILKEIIAYIINLNNINEEAYLAAYPDVRAAVLAGLVASGREHFAKSGYYERRVPGVLAFDPEWYHSHYKDIAERFSRDQESEMRDHFLTQGYFEGRTGTEEDFVELRKWIK